MSIVSSFGGTYSALDYAFGCASSVAPPALQVLVGNSATGAQTITISSPTSITQGGTPFSPIAVGSSIIVGAAGNAETVTVTAIGTASLSGPGPDTGSVTITATFANTHGPQEPVLSATFGLQEALNVASLAGGGTVAIYPSWYMIGGTAAMIAAAVLPVKILNSAGTTGLVRIADMQSLQVYSYGPNSVTVVSAPSAATTATVASTTATGTWTAIAIHVLFTYVTSDGGESLASADYSFTATLNKAIGGTGPAASTGAVGYRVYMGANATTTCYLSPVTAANGTVIQCGPIAAFKIGTSFSVATANVAAALIPVQSDAFPSGFQPSVAGLIGGNLVEGPFQVTGIVTAGTAKESAKMQLPAAYLNRVNKAFRLTAQGIWTPVSTATLIMSVVVGSVYTGTETTIFTATTAASSGTTAADWMINLILRTALVGATGTIEAHGTLTAGLATATAGLGAVYIDTAQAASSAVDLTGQDYIRVLINSGTANVTESQCRTFLLEPLN